MGQAQGRWDMGWISEDAWRRAAEDRPDLPHLAVPVVDPDLGAIAVIRTPDGREFYGADSPRNGQAGQ